MDYLCMCLHCRSILREIATKLGGKKVKKCQKKFSPDILLSVEGPRTCTCSATAAKHAGTHAAHVAVNWEIIADIHILWIKLCSMLFFLLTEQLTVRKGSCLFAASQLLFSAKAWCFSCRNPDTEGDTITHLAIIYRWLFHTRTRMNPERKSISTEHLTFAECLFISQSNTSEQWKMGWAAKNPVENQTHKREKSLFFFIDISAIYVCLR